MKQKELVQKIKNFTDKIDKEKMILICQWVFGGFFLLLALAHLFSDFLASLIIFLTACLFFPPIVRFIENKWKISLTLKAKRIGIITGIILFVIFSKGGAECQIKIHESAENPESVIKSERVLIDVLSDFQEAQLSTVALLSVKFEGIDKEEYLDYIEEVSEKWEKVEKDVAKLEKVNKNAKNLKEPISQHPIFKSALAKKDSSKDDELLSIDFGDGFNGGGDGELELGGGTKEIYGNNPVEEAYAFKRTGLSKTANKYLQGQLKTTAEGAQAALKDYHNTIKLDAKLADDYYAAATKTAQKIAYTSKVALYVLGSVASFGSAAAATSGSGVILGYFSAAWGTAIAGADLALDVSQEVSTMSTGKGLTAYKKDKATIGKISELYAVANLTQIIATGGMKFNGEQFTDANDALAIYNMKDVGVDTFLELDKEIFRLTVGGKVLNPKDQNLDDIIEYFRKGDFSYNKVTVGEEPKAERGGSGLQFQSAKACKNGERVDDEYLKVYWPACDGKKDPCQGLENSCIYKEHCLCKDDFDAHIPGDEKFVISCITQDIAMKLLGIQLGNSFVVENPSITKEEEAFVDKINDPKLIERGRKAMKCGL